MPSEQEHIDYQRIEKAIIYIKNHFKEQPVLDTVAEALHMSPFHFQRMFTDWAGVSPKKFLQYTTIEYSKHLLQDKAHTLFDTAHMAGLSGTGRLHDLFVNIEGMTPGEYKNGGRLLTINYGFYQSHFGKAIIASTEKGICAVNFYEEEAQALEVLKKKFPEATYVAQTALSHESVLQIISGDMTAIEDLRLHLKGTAFQLKVWEALLQIPKGAVSSYGEIATAINKAKASRAVGTAIGSNPIAFLIPCHRVIRANGLRGAYMWGEDRKTAILAWEAAQINI